jgi:hypothetical protein
VVHERAGHRAEPRSHPSRPGPPRAAAVTRCLVHVRPIHPRNP